MSKVVISECQDYRLARVMDTIEKQVGLLGGWNKFIAPGMKVLLKVNLIGPKAPDSAAITHPEFVRALTKILKDHGCTVWIGDSSGGAIAGIAPTARSLKVSGLQEMAESEGAVIKNFDREGVVPVKSTIDSKPMYLAKPLFEADLVINLPKLKTHSASIYTGAIKNLYGCIPGLRKAEYHRLAPDQFTLGQIIADIHEAVNVGLHIMDGITAMQGEGPTAGKPYPARKVLMSTDPLALDTAAASMIGLNVDNIPILVSARQRKLGEASLSRISILGDYSTPPRLAGFKVPKRLTRLASSPRTHRLLVTVIELLKVRPRISTRLCRNCNMCVESCPMQAIHPETKAIDYSTCIECMCCHEVCLYQAVKLKRDNPVMELIGRLDPRMRN